MIKKIWRKKTSSSSKACARYMRARQDSNSTCFRTLALGVVVSVSASVCADEEKKNKVVEFDIPEQRADVSLTEFAKQANITMIFSYDVASRYTTNPVVGDYPIIDAIKLLLEDTNLQVTVGDSGQLLIKNKNFSGEKDLMQRKTKISTAIAGVISSIVGTQSFAQDNVAEEVLVTGIRGSLQRAMDIKRESNGVVDSISAEDIGKFPDSNLAESLQRITGVSVDRSNNEGNQVSVRGFGPTFNMVTLNGRQMPKSSTLVGDAINRAFNFQHIAAEVVSGVDVHKTGKANIDSGGIGATINLKTAKPLDHLGLKLAGSVKAIADQSNVNGEDYTPEISGLFSNVYADGKFGILFALSHSERDSRKEAVVNDGWIPDTGTVYEGVDSSGIDTANNPDQVFWVPRNFAVEYGDHSRTRNNGQLVLQVAPLESVTATFDYTASRFDEEIDRVQTGFWFDSDAGTVGTADSNGTVVNPRHQGHRLNFSGVRQLVETENDSFGLNVEWQVSDDLQVVVDAHDSTSRTQPGGEISEFTSVLSGNTFDVDIGLDFTGSDVPAVTAIPSAGQDPYSRGTIEGDVVVIRGFEVENNIQQFKVGALWENSSDSDLKSIEFGLGNTEYQFDTNERFGFNFINSIDYSDVNVSFTPATVGNAFSGSNQLFETQVVFEPTAINAVVASDGLVDSENPVKTNRVSEETLAAYIALDFEVDFNGIPVNINAGVRYEETDVAATSLSVTPTGLVHLSDEELRQVFATNAEPTADTLTGSYSEFLPNLDIGMSFSDDLVGRFSYSRTITRSDLTQIPPATNITNTRPGGPFNATQGDPNLLPYGSNNLDLSLEWYYDEGSYASLGYFRKYVNNFIGTTVDQRTINGADGTPLKDPVGQRPGCPDTEPNPNCVSQMGDPEVIFDVIVPSNLDDAQVDGWEFAIQHMFGDSGFGTILNYTLVEGDVEYDIFSFSQTVALTGLSDSANFVAFYDKNSIQVRFAYNWRDDFLLQTNQFHSPDEPTFTEAYGQWDMSASYDINQHVSVVFEGINLTQETAHRHGRFENQFLAAEDFGRRFALGVRASF